MPAKSVPNGTPRDKPQPRGILESVIFWNVWVLQSAPWLIYLFFLILGVAGFWWTFAPTRIEGTFNEVKPGGAISLTQQSFWWAALGFSVVTTLVTVSSFELLKLLLEWWRSWIIERWAFNRFWGAGASRRGNYGIVVIQEENIEDAMKAFAPDVSLAKCEINGKPNRFFKAITWVDKLDAEAAKYIREAFWTRGYLPPEMQHIKGSQPLVIHPDAPFMVSVGLFSEQTRSFINEYSGNKLLIRIIQTSDTGDAIELYHSFVKDTRLLEQHVDKSNLLIQLTPKSWDRNKWRAGESSTDFAIILRHTVAHPTSTKPARMIRFVVAGFTEQGTEAAGKYLAKEWKNLHQRFRSNSDQPNRRGDFFLVITGTSNQTDGWSVDPAIDPITPSGMDRIERDLTPRTVQSGGA